MRIGIIGAGAIGSVVGGLLTKAGHDVTLVDQWPEHVEAMKRHGLRLKLVQLVMVAFAWHGEASRIPVPALPRSAIGCPRQRSRRGRCPCQTAEGLAPIPASCMPQLVKGHCTPAHDHKQMP